MKAVANCNVHGFPSHRQTEVSGLLGNVAAFEILLLYGKQVWYFSGLSCKHFKRIWIWYLIDLTKIIYE